MATIEDLRSWMDRDLGRFAGRATHVLETEIRDQDRCRFRLYTRTNVYTIVAREHGGGTKTGYLGCQASSRMPRAGEDCARGRDLSDGDLSEETWRRILGEIVSFEMVGISGSVRTGTTGGTSLPVHEQHDVVGYDPDTPVAHFFDAKPWTKPSA